MSFICLPLVILPHYQVNFLDNTAFLNRIDLPSLLFPPKSQVFIFAIVCIYINYIQCGAKAGLQLFLWEIIK